MAKFRFDLYYWVLVNVLTLGRKWFGTSCMVGLVADAKGDSGVIR